MHMRRVLDRATRWYVTHDHRDQPIAAALARIMPSLELLRTRTSDLPAGLRHRPRQERLSHWDSIGTAAGPGRRASDLLESFGLLDISLMSEQVQEPIPTIADLYYAVFQRIDAARPAAAHHGPAAAEPLGDARPGSAAGRRLLGRGRHDGLGHGRQARRLRRRTRCRGTHRGLGTRTPGAAGPDQGHVCRGDRARAGGHRVRSPWR